MAIGKWNKYDTIFVKSAYTGTLPFEQEYNGSSIENSPSYSFDNKTGLDHSGTITTGVNYNTSNVWDVFNRYDSQWADYIISVKSINSYNGYCTCIIGNRVCAERVKHTYISDVIAVTGTYPQNGKHTDGYWYVYIGLVTPNAPTTLNVPNTVTGGKTSDISWSQATSDGGAISGYELHRSLNNDTFSRAYRGTALTYVDTIPYGSNTVQYSVRSYDVDNQLSAFNVGAVKTVINNNPPTIKGTDTDMGSLDVGFDYIYSVTDEDVADTITVTEDIDGVTVRGFAVTRDTDYTANITDLTWLCLLNGSHTLTITAVDNRGGTAVRTITFVKAVTVIEFELAEPLACDAAATKAIMRMLSALPPTALVTIMASNNANDTDPVWVDVTTKVLDGDKIFFANADKTSTDWGYDIKVRIDRNNAEGDCYITSIGGNFE